VKFSTVILFLLLSISRVSIFCSFSVAMVVSIVFVIFCTCTTFSVTLCSCGFVSVATFSLKFWFISFKDLDVSVEFCFSCTILRGSSTDRLFFLIADFAVGFCVSRVNSSCSLLIIRSSSIWLLLLFLFLI
jgi:hypothetical protein